MLIWKVTTRPHQLLFLYEVYYFFIEYQPSVFLVQPLLRPLPQSSLLARKTLVHCLSSFIIFFREDRQLLGQGILRIWVFVEQCKWNIPGFNVWVLLLFSLSRIVFYCIAKVGGPWSDIIWHRAISTMISCFCPFNPPRVFQWGIYSFQDHLNVGSRTKKYFLPFNCLATFAICSQSP